MLTTIKKHLFSLLLSTMIALVVLEFLLPILWGYTSGDIFVFLLMDIVPSIGYFWAALCLIATIRSIAKHQHKMSFTVSWVLFLLLLFAVGKIPLSDSETVGGLLSLYGADPHQIVVDARKLAKDYPPMTCFGFRERPPCDHPIASSQIPTSIRRIYASQNILVLNDYVLIEKFGLLGVFRGFVVFQEDADPWQNEQSVTRQEGCSDCWKIRITDGLYWYADSDTEEHATFRSPLK